MKHGTAHEGGGNCGVVVITEIDVWFQKCQEGLKGQFLFPLKAAELISYWRKEHKLRPLSLVHEDVILRSRINRRPISTSEMFNFFLLYRVQLLKWSLKQSVKKKRFALRSMDCRVNNVYSPSHIWQESSTLYRTKITC